MEEVKLNLTDTGHGYFFFSDGKEQVAKMEISVSGDELTVYHTEVLPKAEGNGLAKKLFTAMVDHARKNQLKVIALCPFVRAQFKGHSEEYADIWKNK